MPLNGTLNLIFEKNPFFMQFPDGFAVNPVTKNQSSPSHLILLGPMEDWGPRVVSHFVQGYEALTVQTYTKETQNSLNQVIRSLSFSCTIRKYK